VHGRLVLGGMGHSFVDVTPVRGRFKYLADNSFALCMVSAGFLAVDLPCMTRRRCVERSRECQQQQQQQQARHPSSHPRVPQLDTDS